MKNFSDNERTSPYLKNYKILFLNVSDFIEIIILERLK
jgi:hypothetical protein